MTCTVYPYNVHDAYSSACIFFFFNDTATTEIYTLSLHDALPISPFGRDDRVGAELEHHQAIAHADAERAARAALAGDRSEEHTSELQSRLHLVCRLLLEKKKKVNHVITPDSSASLFILHIQYVLI